MVSWRFESSLRQHSLDVLERSLVARSVRKDRVDGHVRWVSHIKRFGVFAASSGAGAFSSCTIRGTEAPNGETYILGSDRSGGL
jgi:hypothetical protein